MRWSLNATLLLAILPLTHCFAPVAAQQAAQRSVVRNEADLPMHSYKVDAPTASELLKGGPALDALAEQLRSDTENTLRDYEIPDVATRRQLYEILRRNAILKGESGKILRYGVVLRGLTDKPADRMLSGLTQDAIAKALAAGPDPAAQRAALQGHLVQTLKAMPWKTVGDDLVALRARFAQPGLPAIIGGVAQAQIDPVLARNGALGADLASQLVWFRALIVNVEPWRREVTAVLDDYIAAHRV